MMRVEKLPQNAEKMGLRFMDGLRKMRAQYSVIGNMRLRSLMVGTEGALIG